MENAEHGSSPIQGPGVTLKKARVARQLSVQQVATRLNILPSFLEYLEDDNYTKLTGGPTFARGYIRAYAAYVELNGDELVTIYNAHFAFDDGGVKKTKARTDANPENKGAVGSKLGSVKKRYVSLSVLLIVAFVAGVWLFFSAKVAEPLVVAPAPANEKVAPANSHVADEAKTSEDAAKNADSPKGESASVSDRELELLMQAGELSADSSASDDEETVTETAMETAVAVVEAPVIEGDRLTLTVSEESWVEIRDGSGEYRYGDLAKPGDEIVVDGDAPFSVVLGNAPGVSVALNGKVVPVRASRSKRAEFTVPN